jgi:hypothetical protein
MIDIAFYLVTKDIAQRAGLVGERYIAPDGRYILDNKDLARIRFSTDEYVSGLQGVEKITQAQAKTLIAQGGYNMGEKNNVEEVATEEPDETNEEETTENNEQEKEEE